MEIGENTEKKLEKNTEMEQLDISTKEELKVKMNKFEEKG